MRQPLSAVVLSVVLLTGCGSDDTAERAAEPTAASEVTTVIEDGAVVIDVRTPSEFAAGHVTDALNIDVSAESFGAKVAALDKDERYVVYCRSGRRSGRAIEMMAELGFENLVNGGAFDDLAAAGAPTS